MPILSKAGAKMMSAELPLLTRTLCTVLLATMAFITLDRRGDADNLSCRSPKKLW